MPIVEIAICVTNLGPDAAQEGDIVAAREPLGYVGLGEMDFLLWLWIDVTEQVASNLIESDGNTKRRFQIPLQRLRQLVPDLDMGRVTDKAIKYQPLLNIDSQTGIRRGQMTPLRANGLVMDKRTRGFIRG